MAFRRYVILMAMVLVGAACSDVDAVPVTTSQVPTTTAVPGDPVDEAAALGVIEAAYELYNSGDAEAWIELRDTGSFYESTEDRQVALAGELEFVEEQMAANSHYEVGSCTSYGLGEWSGIADQGVAVGYKFTCGTDFISDSDAFEVDDFFTWVVADGAVVAVRGS